MQRMQKNSFCSPAKLNLFFRVLTKREDGFHEIFSLFQAINLKDTLTFQFSSKDELISNSTNVPLDASNLIFRASHIFQKNLGKTFFIKVHLQKSIPIQAGLGGGSSNAATTLWALNTFFKRPFSVQELISMGKELGSDVPFFFSLGTAFCRGRGELLEDTTLNAPFQAYLAKPNFGLCTASVYQNLKLNKQNSSEQFFNDLEKSAFELEPRLILFKQKLLDSGFSRVVMSGSGTSYFCFGEGSYPALKIKGINRKKELWY